MNRYLRLCVAMVLVGSLFANTARSQNPPPQSAQPPATTIKLHVVLARFEGEKKLSSFPYTLSLVPGQSGSIRAGAEVPVPTTSFTPASSGDKAAATPAYTMQQVGSQVDATVTPTADGKFNLKLNVTDRSIGSAQSTQGRVPNVPSFKNMVSNSQAIISNGETIQFTASSDPASNETFRIDVTLTVGNK
jgi:hypothetical protein